MVKKKDEIQIKWSWKVFFIILFLGLWIWTAYDYSKYEMEVESLIHELELNLTKYTGEFDSNYDCYPRGHFASLECHEKGTLECFELGTISKLQNELTKFERDYDCYERGSAYCYDEPRALYNCDTGYSLACVPN